MNNKKISRRVFMFKCKKGISYIAVATVMISFAAKAAGEKSPIGIKSIDDFVNGGNAFGGATSIGTNDNYDLSVKTNNSVVMTLKTDGKVGVGTTTPTSRFEVSGGDAKVNGLTLGLGGASNNTSTVFGNSALGSNFGGISNTAIGYRALKTNTVGSYNTAVGLNAMNDNTTGDTNAAFGGWALGSNTTGIQNVAVGYGALVQNTTGSNNVSVGHGAAWSGGSANVAIGTYSLYGNSGGGGNVSIGYESLYTIGSSSSYNTAVGFHAGYGLTTGERNTMIGANMYISDPTVSNNIMLADGSGNVRIQVNSNGNVGIGVSSATSKLQVNGKITPAVDAVYDLGDSSLRFNAVYAQNGTIQTSDINEKKNIQDSDLGLSFIKMLRPVSYQWKRGTDTGLHYGLIAQETKNAIKAVKKVDKEEGLEEIIVAYDKKSGRYGLRYTELIGPMIKSIQQLSEEIKSSQKEIQQLKLRNYELEEKLAAKEQ
jgi:trimeric autotransporter adhesin